MVDQVVLMMTLSVILDMVGYRCYLGSQSSSDRNHHHEVEQAIAEADAAELQGKTVKGENDGYMNIGDEAVEDGE